jgi:hypothetical protein
MICPVTDKVCKDNDCKECGCLLEQEEEGEDFSTTKKK